MAITRYAWQGPQAYGEHWHEPKALYEGRTANATVV